MITLDQRTHAPIARYDAPLNEFDRHHFDIEFAIAA